MRLDETTSQFLALMGRAQQGFIDALPSIATAVIVLTVGWGLAWALRKAMLAAIRRVAKQSRSDASTGVWAGAIEDRNVGRIAAGGVYWLILLTAILLAIDALDVPILRRWIDAVAGYLPRIALAGALVVGGVVVGRLAANAVVNTAFRVPAAQARSLARLVQISILVAAGLIAAGQLGLDVSLLTSVFLIALAATLGSAALAFGLGARDIMANILAMHYVHKSFRVGQVVRIGSDQGRIVRTTRTAVHLESDEGELSIPGRELTDNRCVLVSEDGSRES